MTVTRTGARRKRFAASKAAETAADDDDVGLGRVWHIEPGLAVDSPLRKEHIPSMSSTVVVGPRGAERGERGHPWIYQSDVVEIRARGGDVVEVWTPRGRKLGDALYSDRSQIALRLLTRGEERFDVDAAGGADSARRSRFASDLRSTRRRIAWFTPRPTGCRR